MTALADCSLFDTHCHLTFATDAFKLAAAAGALGVGAASCTVTPQDFERASRELAECENVRIAAGAHPWWADAIGADEPALGDLRRMVEHSRFVGEIGLDFGARCAADPEKQRAIFRAVIGACARAGERLLSIHAVHAAGEVLDLLEEAGCFGATTIVFHWFSGSSSDLERAVQAGCFFSVGERMLASRRGRAYARQIPADRLLLESDAPPRAPESPVAPEPSRTDAQPSYTAEELYASLAHTLSVLEAIRSEPLADRIAATSRRLLLGEGL